MISRYAKGKVFIFIDASNIFHDQKSLKWNIDFKKLLEYFKDETDLGRIFYYTAFDPEYKKQKKFLDFLDIIGFKVRKKAVKFIRDTENDLGGFHKGNLDVELTIDAVHNRDNFDTFVLFSGDSDFEYLIKYMKAYKKNCIVISTKGHVSIELIRQAKYINIKKLRKYIEE